MSRIYQILCYPNCFAFVLVNVFIIEIFYKEKKRKFPVSIIYNRNRLFSPYFPNFAYFFPPTGMFFQIIFLSFAPSWICRASASSRRRWSTTRRSSITSRLRRTSSTCVSNSPNCKPRSTASSSRRRPSTAQDLMARWAFSLKMVYKLW